jgi:hypothetical protein
VGGYIKSSIINLFHIFYWGTVTEHWNCKLQFCISYSYMHSTVLCKYQFCNGNLISTRHKQKALILQVMVAALEKLQTQDHNLNIYCSRNFKSNEYCTHYWLRSCITHACSILLSWSQSWSQHICASNRFDFLNSAELWFQQQLEATCAGKWIGHFSRNDFKRKIVSKI